jgi:RNA-binding protein Nova
LKPKNISNQIFFSKDVVDMEVQENVIGAVIGPAGRSIVELQQFSGARIQVSKKGAFSPGTR